MKKLNIVSILILLITIFFISKFNMINGFDFLGIMYPLSLAIVIAMLYKKKNIKKYKTIYNISLGALLLPSLSFVGYIIYNIIDCSFNPFCAVNITGNNQMLLLILVFVLLLFNILDIKKEKSIVTHILTWIISTIVIIIYFRYYYDIDFIHNYMYQSQIEIQDSYIYITQNYIYFNILYISVLIHYVINKEK